MCSSDLTAAEAREYGFIDEIVGSFGQVVPDRKHRIGLQSAELGASA